jgi:nitrogenase-stabilizing/protective protein
MRNTEFERELAELSSAEDFLDHFEVAYDPDVVRVNRLHILQRFHDYLDRDDERPTGDAECTAHYARWLARAYADFVSSNARTEKVFKVFHSAPPEPVFVKADMLRK